MNGIDELPVVRIHKDIPIGDVPGVIKYVMPHGLTVLRDGVRYKIELVDCVDEKQGEQK